MTRRPCPFDQDANPDRYEKAKDLFAKRVDTLAGYRPYSRLSRLTDGALKDMADDISAQLLVAEVTAPNALETQDLKRDFIAVLDEMAARNIRYNEEC